MFGAIVDTANGSDVQCRVQLNDSFFPKMNWHGRQGGNGTAVCVCANGSFILIPQKIYNIIFQVYRYDDVSVSNKILL